MVLHKFVKAKTINQTMTISDELTFLSILALALLSGLFGVLLGAFISNWNQKRSEIRQAKLKVLQQMMGNSFNLSREGFAEAINQVFVVFYDSKEVVLALKTFHQYSIGQQKR